MRCVHRLAHGILPSIPLIDLRFDQGIYNALGRRCPTLDMVPGYSFARSRAGFARTAGGLLMPFAANQPCITDLGIQIEETRQNLLTFSQQFDHTNWTKGDVVITPNAAIAPDGTMTADMVTISATNVAHHLQQTPISTAAGPHIDQIFAKAGTENILVLWTSVGGAVGQVNLTTGAVTGAVQAQPFANGWWFVWAPFTATTSAAAGARYYFRSASSYLGAEETMYLWQADWQPGLTPRSPVVTTSTSLTQSSDVLKIMTPWLTSFPYSVFAEATFGSVIPTKYQRFIADHNSALAHLSLNGAGPRLASWNGGTQLTSAAGGSALPNRRIRGAARLRSTGTTITADGLPVVSDTLQHPAVGGFQIGGSGDVTTYINTFMTRASIMGDITDAQMTAMTPP